MSPSTRPFRVLCIDGGGMRGIYSAAYLDCLGASFARKRGVSSLDFGKAFHLIVGSSTGAIIACALAAGIEPKAVVEFYRHHGRAVFPAKVPRAMGLRLLAQLFTRSRINRAGDNALRLALYKAFNGVTLSEVYEKRGVALAIPAIEMSKHAAWVFKTPHLANTLRRDDDCTIADACLAATAAPVYRSMARIQKPGEYTHRIFVDGGLWANSPVLVGLIDALDMTQKGSRIELYTLGTCPRPEGEHLPEKGIHRGLLGWGFGAAVAALSMDAQSSASHQIAVKLAAHLDRDCVVVRFPQAPVPHSLMKFLDLDETRDEAMDALVGHAQSDANFAMGRIQNAHDQESEQLKLLLNSVPQLQHTATLPIG